MRIYLLLAFAVYFSLNNIAFAQDSTESLAQKIEILELKLQLAEAQIQALEEECDQLRKTNAMLTKTGTGTATDAEDQFAPGVGWVGVSKAVGAEKSTRWAISISKRDGDKFEGAVAATTPAGNKVEFPVSGKAPRSGDGLMVMESPTIGRAKIFMRGNVRNGAIALAFSGTNPLGKKMFGAASLAPKN